MEEFPGIEQIFEFGEKYNMTPVDIIGLKNTIIIGAIAVQKCLDLGLESEVREEFDKTMEEMMK